MVEFVLEPRSALGGWRVEIADAVAAEVACLALFSLATFARGDLPAPGRVAEREGALALAIAADQWLVEIAGDGGGGETAAALAPGAAVTDQSDAWVAVDLDGALSRAALERICPIDLAPAAFGADAVARTVMAHLGVIIRRRGPGFRLYSARSSARDFAHAIETSLRNVA